MQLQVNADYPMIFNTIKLKLARKQYKPFCLQKYFPLTFFFTELINNDWRSGMHSIIFKYFKIQSENNTWSVGRGEERRQSNFVQFEMALLTASVRDA